MDLPELGEEFQIYKKVEFEKLYSIQDVFRNYIDNVLNERVLFENYIQKSLPIFESIPLDLPHIERLLNGIKPFTDIYKRSYMSTKYREQLQKEAYESGCPNKYSENQYTLPPGELKKRQNQAKKKYIQYLLSLSSIFTASKELMSRLVEDIAAHKTIAPSKLRTIVHNSSTVISHANTAAKVLYR
ncbi:hypothetical protein HC823_02405 [Candidatus Gracilibacteria bacterium]|nr:hypothetical protein [Candidatus Gracilibacteria bacterium]